MKIRLSLVSLLYLTSINAQDHRFTQTAEAIQKKVLCCSVPFAASTDAKVDSIAIDMTGNISLFYSDKREKNSFNLFELYKETEWETGIDTILKGKFIQFSVNENRVRLIRFASARDAKEVYQAFLELLMLRKAQSTMFVDLNFAQIVDEINIRLSRWAERGNNTSLSASEDGTIIIRNSGKVFFRFNLLELIPPRNDKWIGIETLVCDPGSHAPLSWINFKTLKGSAGFIRLDCRTPDSELQIIRSAFFHLKSFVKNPETSFTPLSGAMHFISRTTVINTNKEIVSDSKRAIDRKVDSDTTLLIKSNGEGWLDKDSMPIGEWKFYALSDMGNEYLFKSGIYQRTEPNMFKVKGIDSSELIENYYLSFTALQESQVQTIPFIKSGEWNYYHPNGSLWKKVHYINKEIPIETKIMLIDPENTTLTKLIIVLNDRLDEWEAE